MINNAIGLLESLKADARPAFGIMTAQHMVEHLIWSLMVSNGGKKSELHFRQEKAEKMKDALIYTDAEMPIGFRAPVLPVGEVIPLEYPNLEEAKRVFMEELSKFHDYFEKNPEATEMNPSLGLLSHKEWLVFHEKHFIHHFKQFNLLSSVGL